jgi:hypothetical protein
MMTLRVLRPERIRSVPSATTRSPTTISPNCAAIMPHPSEWLVKQLNLNGNSAASEWCSHALDGRGARNSSISVGLALIRMAACGYDLPFTAWPQHDRNTARTGRSAGRARSAARQLCPRTCGDHKTLTGMRPAPRHQEHDRGRRATTASGCPTRTAQKGWWGGGNRCSRSARSVRRSHDASTHDMGAAAGQPLVLLMIAPR